MSSNSPSDELRKEAIHRVKAKQGFWRLAGIFAIVSLILTGIWAMSGTGYFWPMWAMFGMGIALAFVGLGAYGPQSTVTDEQIERELQRMRGE